MTQITVIPTLFALDKESFSNKLKKISFSKKIHIDFMDGGFTDNKSVFFDEMGEILKYPDIDFSAHLMAYEPEEYASKIKRLGINKVFLHYEVFETDTDFQYALDEFSSRGIKVGLAINPGTDVEDIISYLEEVSSVLVMSVWPGKEGQTFISNSNSRISQIRKKFPKIEICVDGGINEENIKSVFDSGANVVGIGSYISSSKDPKLNYEKISKLI